MVHSGIFYEDTGEYHVIYCRKGLSLPEGVPIFLLLQRQVVIDYVVANLV